MSVETEPSKSTWQAQREPSIKPIRGATRNPRTTKAVAEVTENLFAMNNKLRYQEFVDELRFGKIHGVFIDDTGSPGLKNTPKHLHPERKSWVAVIVPKTQIAEVWQQFPGALYEMKKLTGAGEFHFADIYAGRKEFKDVPFELRLGVFGFMAYIFKTYNFPVFVQTLDPELLKDICRRAEIPNKLGHFNLWKHEDLALFFLLIRVKWYLEGAYKKGGRIARVFVDEGYKANGVGIAMPALNNVFADGLICFARSDTIFPIQLADFAAFCLNRTQLLLGKQKLSYHDKKFIEIIQPMVSNYQNIPKVLAGEWSAANRQ